MELFNENMFSGDKEEGSNDSDVIKSALKSIREFDIYADNCIKNAVKYEKRMEK